MKFLIIDGYAENKLGREEFHEFYGIINNIIRSENDIDCGQYDILTKRYDNLEEYIIDWEYSSLLSNSPSCSKAFDTIDMVCLSGDMKLLPWDSSCYQLITFIHMCNLLQKPLLTCGSGAHFAIYTCATQGMRFQILNQPHGDTIENIRTQPTYFKGPKGYPCGWLDHETGDIYSYDNNVQRWTPVVNIGIYRHAQTGTPTPSRYRPVKKKFGVENRLLSHQLPSTSDDHDGLIIIRQNQHQYYGFKSFQSFVLSGKVLNDWQFNVDGALPIHTGLEILADGPHGPIIFKYHEYSLHIACSLTNHHTSDHIKQLIRNYYHHLFSLIRTKNTLGSSCYHFIYVQHNGDINESTKLSLHLSPPLSSLSIKSKLKDGPKLIHSPVTEIHETPHIPVCIPDISHIVGPPKLGTTRVFKQQYRDPYRMNHLRLHQLFETCYGENKTKELIHISEIMRQRMGEERGGGDRPQRNEYVSSSQIQSARSRTPSPSPSRPISPTSSSRPASPAIHLPVPQPKPPNIHSHSQTQTQTQTIPATTEQKRSSTAIRYEAYNRTLIAEDNYRRSQTTSGDPRRGSTQPPNTRPIRSTNPTNRINWKSDWRVVRGSDIKDLEETHDSQEEGHHEHFQMSLEEEAKLCYLPVTHPMSRPVTTIGTSSPGSSYVSVYKSTNPTPTSTVVITRLRPQSAKPYSGYKEYEKKIAHLEEEEAKGEYRGVFRGGYLTPYEKERKEYHESKNKFLNGEFKTCSGRASRMPLRSEGGVQAHGPYPPPIQSNKDITKVGYYGPWKPTADLYPNERDRSFEKSLTRANSNSNSNSIRNKLKTR